MRVQARRILIRILAGIIVAALALLVFLAPAIAVIIFLILSGFISYVKWRTEGKWAAIKDAFWTILSRW